MELQKQWRKEEATTWDKWVSFYHGIQDQMRKLFIVILNLWIWSNFIESKQDTDSHSYQPPGCCKVIFSEKNRDSESNEKLLKGHLQHPSCHFTNTNMM